MTRAGCGLAAAAFASCICGCEFGDPASPSFSNGADATVVDDGGVTYAICPPDMDATFGSILTKMFNTAGCGTNQMNSCHSATGAPSTGNGLDFSEAGAVVYAELLGDGGGAPATNISGSAHGLRVVPGDASASLLYIKLALTSSADPLYGAGMPLSTPGSVCPAALDAVKGWINGGAKP